MEPLEQSVGTFSHDKLMGVLWAEFVDRFYKGSPEKENTAKLMQDWEEKTQGWLAPSLKNKLASALDTWARIYYQEFRRDDGCRNGSEKLVENDRFLGYVDGLSHDLVLHEVKTTSRSPNLAGQLWKVQNSIQVKLYCVLTKAVGICIEFAWKDAPHSIYRSEVIPVSEEQRKAWEQELNALADYIYSLGEDEKNYPCHPDGCCITGKNMTSMCQYEMLCSYGLDSNTQVMYKIKESRK